MAPTPNVCLKRKRPPSIEIPNVLGEIRMENSTTPRNDGVSFGEVGVGVFSRKGKKKFMEDTHKIASCLQDNPNKRFFFGVYDGHGGKKAAEFVAENLHNNVLEMMKNCDEKEEGVKAGYLKTDQDFLKQDICSGACCVTAVIEEGDEVIVSNVGDCRAVLCRGGVAEALTKDHTVEKEEERKRIEAKGGYVEIHRGAWRVHGVLTVSRSIGDAHLKDWVLAEPETKILKLTPDMDFLILASDGLWEKGVQEEEDEQYQCKVELKPWYFWRKNGDKQFVLDGTIVNVAWDLKAAKFNGETEPQSDYYVAIVCEEEVVLLVGDMKKDAFRKTGCRPSLIDPILVSRKEHLFGKRKFSTRVKFHEKANSHEILIECNNSIIPSYDSTTGMISTGSDPELEVQVDGKQVLHVKHLQWKFRGNESVFVSKTKVEVYWDVHDWLFSSGTRHGMFIFSPISSSSTSSLVASSSSSSSSNSSIDHHHDQSGECDDYVGGSSRFSLFVYAWKVE